MYQTNPKDFKLGRRGSIGINMQSNHAIKVFIVGDSHIVRSGLRKIIETQATTRVLGEVSVRRAERQTRWAAQNPDLVVVDLDPRGTDPLAFIGAFHEALENAAVLVLRATPPITD